MMTGEAAYRVDLDELDGAATALAGIRDAAERAGASIRDAAGSSGGWAVDGDLPSAFERLCRTLGWAADQAHELAGTLRDGVAAATREYADAEAAARLDPRDAGAVRRR